MPDRAERRVSSRTRRATAMAIALALLGCVQAMPGGPPSGTAPLTGLAQFPEAMVESGQVLPTGIGSVIQAGGQVLPTGVGSYRVRHAGHGLEELPVVGATVVLRDPATRERRSGVAPVRTDEGGRFRFEAAPADNHLVEVVFLKPDGSAAHRLLSLARGGGDVRVSWRSTAAVAHWLQTPGRDWQSADAAALALEEAAQAARVEALPEPDRLSFFGVLLGAPASALGSDGPPAGPLPLPSLAPAPDPSAAPSLLPSPLASTAGQVVETVGDVVEKTTDTVGDTVETTTETVGETVDQTTDTVGDVVDTTTDTVKEILPSPSLPGLL